MKVSLVGVVNHSLAIAGLINLGFGTYYMACGDAVVGGAGVAAGLVLLLTSTIDRFELLKGLGMEAKTRKLQHTINQADIIMSKMKLLAKLTCSNLVKLQTRPGPDDAAVRPVVLRQHVRQVKEILSSLEFDQSEVRAVLDPFLRVVSMDVARAALMRHHNRLASALEERNVALSKYGYPGPSDDPEFVQQRLERDELQNYRVGLQPGYTGQGGPRLSRQLSPKETASALRDAPVYQPSTVSAPLRQTFRDETELWATEIEYLDKQLDFRNPDMWTEPLALAEVLLPKA